MEGLGKLGPGGELQLLGERFQDQPENPGAGNPEETRMAPRGHDHSSVGCTSGAGLDLHSGD